MFEILSGLAILGGLACLWRLWIIDMRFQILPNEYVLGFFMAACLFHLTTFFSFLTPVEMALGAFIGGGGLYVVRGIANALYKKDALGLGDIKLMAAAGALLGPYNILLALTIGAAIGALHGLALHIKDGRTESLQALSLPAGPGFICGIVVTGILAFHNLTEIF